jgi:hypothetical protein
MRDYNFEEPQVAGEKIQRSKSFSIIPFTIKGRVSLENLTEFLYRFHAYEPRVLHHVRSLNIVRPDGKSKNLTVTIAVAALALDDAPHRGPLIAAGENPKELNVADVPLEKFQVIAKTNIFEPFVEPPPKEGDKPEVDAARYVVYSGFTLTGDVPEAWIYDRLNNRNRFLKAGDNIDVADLNAKIVSIAASKIVLEMNDKQWSLKLGKNLREMTELGRVAQSDESNSVKSVDPEKTSEVVPADSSSPGQPETSDEKTGKIGPTVPVRKDAAEPESEATKADGGS